MLLEMIKRYPKRFEYTALRRANTTPSEYNRTSHIKLASAIEKEEWGTVLDVISDKQYSSALSNLICCLNMIDYDLDGFTVDEHKDLIYGYK